MIPPPRQIFSLYKTHDWPVANPFWGSEKIAKISWPVFSRITFWSFCPCLIFAFISFIYFLGFIYISILSSVYYYSISWSKGLLIFAKSFLLTCAQKPRSKAKAALTMGWCWWMYGINRRFSWKGTDLDIDIFKYRKKLTPTQGRG